MNERRRHPRAPLKVPVYLFPLNRPPVPAELSDISNGGLCVRTPLKIPLEQGVVLEFALRSGAQCSASGKVVRPNRDPSGLGVQFEQANDQMLQFVSDLGALRPELRSEFIAQVLDPKIHIS